MDREHSINGLIPYIKFYLPDVRVVPIILRRDVNEYEAKKIAVELNNLMDADSVLVASVDFSHYLDANAAVKKNSETLEVINTRNYKQLFQMNDDNLDSPPTLAVLLAWTELRGLELGRVLFNTNSGILKNSKYTETTSYLSIVY